MSVTFSGTGTLTQEIVLSTTGIVTATTVIIEGYSIINIGAFTSLSALTSVTISSSVTSIGQNAFYESGLTTVYIADDQLPGIKSPDTGVSFFGATDVTTQLIPVTFSGTGVLTQNIVNAGIGLATTVIIEGYNGIGQSAFYNLTALTSVTIPSTVTSIGQSAFQGCTGLTSVTIPSTVTSIAGYAFQGCTKLTSVTIPSTVTSIAGSSYQGSGLTTVYISDNQVISGITFESPNTTPISFFGSNPVITQVPPTVGAAPSTGNNLLESTSAGVGAVSGVAAAAGLAALLNKRNNHNVLKIAAGVGSVIGTTLHGVLRGQPSHKMVENGVVGLAGAMAGYACGQYINEGYAKGNPANAELKQESPNFYDALSNAGFSGLGAGLFISGKQMVRGLGACKPPFPC
jgi:hypothetical protein